MESDRLESLSGVWEEAAIGRPGLVAGPGGTYPVYLFSCPAATRFELAVILRRGTIRPAVTGVA